MSGLHNHSDLVHKLNNFGQIQIRPQGNRTILNICTFVPLFPSSQKIYRKPHGWKHLSPIIWSFLTPGSRPARLGSAFVWYFSWNRQLVAFLLLDEFEEISEGVFFILPLHERVSYSLSKGNSLHVLILGRADSGALVSAWFITFVGSLWTYSLLSM